MEGGGAVDDWLFQRMRMAQFVVCRREHASGGQPSGSKAKDRVEV